MKTLVISKNISRQQIRKKRVLIIRGPDSSEIELDRSRHGEEVTIIQLGTDLSNWRPSDKELVIFRDKLLNAVREDGILIVGCPITIHKIIMR